MPRHTPHVPWTTHWQHNNSNILNTPESYTPAMRRTLRTALKYGACSATCLLATLLSMAFVVYAIIPLAHTEHRIYVGSTTATLAQRLSGHLSAARDIHRTLTAPPGHRELYHWLLMASGGHLPINPNSFCVIVLQHLPPNITEHALRYVEQRWVHVLHARHPFGFNNRRANSLGKNNIHYDTHLPQPLRGLGTNRFNSTSVEHTLFSVLTRHDLVPYIPFVKHLVVTRQCRPTHDELRGVTKVKLDAAIHILTHISTHRLGVTEIMHTNLIHTLMQVATPHNTTIQPEFSLTNMLFLHPSYRYITEKINLNHILRSPHVMMHWSPPPCTSTHPGEVAPPCIAFKPAPPTSLMLCQNKQLANAIDFDDCCKLDAHGNPIWDTLNSRTHCACRTHANAINQQLGHILTCEHHLLVKSNNLLNVLRRGPRFRSPLLLRDEASDLESFLHHLTDSLQTYLNKRKLPPNLHPWATTWLEVVRQACLDELNKLQTTHDNHLDHTHEIEMARQYDLDLPDLQELQDLRRHFAIITVDKASDLYVIVCKNFLYKKFLTDLSNSDFFQVLTDDTTTATTIVQQQLQQLLTFNMAPRRDSQLKIGYYTATAKLHKKPPTFRFITSSNDCVTERMNIYLTRILTEIQLFAHQLFHDTLTDTQLDTYTTLGAHRPKSWILKSSFEAVQIVQHYNRHRMSNETANRNMAITVADFERLYTFIDQQDCIHRVNQITDLCFQHHEHHVLKVYFAKDTRPQWIPPHKQHFLPSPGNTGKDAHGEYYVFDYATFATIFTWMMQNNYFEFGGRVFHQTKGIAMGTNASVLIANLYLFTYELQFVQQHWFKPPSNDATATDKLNHRIARKTLTRCLYSMRFIDDGAFLANRDIEKLLKRPAPNTPYSMGAPGYYTLHTPDAYITGIYPHYLNITHSTSTAEHFMDIQFGVARDPSDNVPYFTTRIYDKRDHELNTLPDKTYVHPHSDTPLWCKLGVITSQLQRFAHMTIDMPEFIYHAARVIHRMQLAGYNTRDLNITLHKAIKKAARIYAMDNPRSLEREVRRALDYCFTAAASRSLD